MTNDEALAEAIRQLDKAAKYSPLVGVYSRHNASYNDIQKRHRGHYFCASDTWSYQFQYAVGQHWIAATQKSYNYGREAVITHVGDDGLVTTMGVNESWSSSVRDQVLKAIQVQCEGLDIWESTESLDNVSR